MRTRGLAGDPNPQGFLLIFLPNSTVYTQNNAAYTTKNFKSYHQHFFLHVSFCNECKLWHVTKVTE